MGLLDEAKASKIDVTSLETDDEGRLVLPLTTEVADGKDGRDTVVELRFRRPTAGDILAMDEEKGSQAGIAVMVSRLCGLPKKLVHKLDGYDYLQASEVVGYFLTRPRKTGETS
jgi:hypothetical protein